MLGLSFGHLMMVFLVVLFFGHKRLPELGHALGRGIGAFKRGLDGKSTDEVDSEEAQKLLK